MSKVDLKRTKKKMYSFELTTIKSGRLSVETKDSLDNAIRLANCYLQSGDYKVGDIFENEVEQFETKGL